MNSKDINQIIDQGEGYYTEFKRSITSDIKKEMVAFANASGGRILLGVDDDGNVGSVAIDNAMLSKVQDHAQQCDPSVDISLQQFDNILVIHVAEGKNKPYRCTGGFYLRVGANSQKMNTDEIVDFIQFEGRVRFDEQWRPGVNFRKVFSESLLDKFLKLSGINTTQSPGEILNNLEVLQMQGDMPVLNNAGLLLFVNQPSEILSHAIITTVAYKGVEKLNILDRKDFTEDLISNIESTIAFLKRHLNMSARISGTRREDILEIPEVALREAVVNAVTHRNYWEKGACVMVEVFDDRVLISSPGGLAKGLKKADFGKHSLTRNSLLASLLYRARYIEKLGTGITRMRDAITEANLPEPQFEFNGFFSVVFKRVGDKEEIAKVRDKFGISSGKVRDKFGKTPEQILKLIDKNREITIPEMAQKIGITSRAVEKHLSSLKRLGLIERIGSRKDGHWKIIIE